MNVIAICNQKGGVAKTTTAINLSAALGIAKKKVLLIDLDPQGNATMGFGINKKSLNKSIFDVCIQKLAIDDIIIKTEFKNVTIAPTNQDLTAAEVAMTKISNAHLILKNSLAQLNVKNNFDFVIIDCPPALNILTVNALTAATSVIVPIQCEYYALEGLSDLLDTVSDLQRSVNNNLVILGFLRTMYDSRANLSSEVSQQLEHFLKKRMFSTIIPRNVRLAEAPSHGQPISYYDKSSKGSVAYNDFTKEVIKRCKTINKAEEEL